MSRCTESLAREPRFARALLACLVLLNLVVWSGCKAWHKGPSWSGGERQVDLTIHGNSDRRPCKAVTRNPLVGAAITEPLLQQASALEAACEPGCVDLYFAAACQGWQDLVAHQNCLPLDDLLDRATAYHASLAKLIMTAQRYGRIDPVEGLQVTFDGQPVTVPIERHGFAWGAEDFDAFELVGEYTLTKRATEIRTKGIGVPLVVIRRRSEQEQFYRKKQAFSATVVLRSRNDCVAPCADPFGENLPMGGFVLEFYNAAHITKLDECHPRLPLASDLTAPLAWQLSQNPSKPILDYVRPNAQGGAQLVMLEPYQVGKIPVVFVHGVISDPTTWVTLGNELRAQAWFRERFQVWAFRYPSGIPFLVSAATLRRELGAALASNPQAADDPAARQMVLIGHSMGGLVVKLQVTESGTALWDLVANRPLDAIHASDADRQQLREVFFFEPLPFVKRVVYIGTPHRGASLASRGVGRVGSLLARQTSEADDRHRRLVADNPGVFVNWMRHRVPSSVDLLEPGNPLLCAMEKLPVSPDVQLHSIIGVAKVKSHAGPGDGVVLLTSATLACVASEKLVSEKHEELHRARSTMNEIERILQQHLRCSGLPVCPAKVSTTLLDRLRRSPSRFATPTMPEQSLQD